MNGRLELRALVVASMIVLFAGQVAVAQVEWTIGDVVVPPGPPGSWDEGGHMMGGVVFDGAAYHMYLVGGPGGSPIGVSWQIGHWASTDGGQTWDPDANPVVPADPGGWDAGIGSFAVLYDGTMFHMWYSAAAAVNAPSYVGYATDDDGWGPWTKYADNPLESLEPGPPGSWDDHGVAPRTVLAEGSTLRMWYTAFQGGYFGHPWRIGHATSTDAGITWARDPDPVLEASEPWEGYQVYWPTVVNHGGSYHMWYSGLLAGVSVYMGYADSPDGLSWRKWPGNPVLTGLPGCYVVDSIAVLLQGNTIHGWVGHCSDMRSATSSWFFADDFETGTTDAWSLVMP